ncbi:MAG: ATP-grasp domain-containing protein [Candidatus Altarchaeum sp.]|nr:ATP-grasp domain-containing protein [Candidatus Altarchaeum sp.]
MGKKIGIIGLNARATAQSAKRAGYDVFLTTYFCDIDTSAVTKNFFSMQKEKFEPDLKEYSVNALADFATEKFKGKLDDVILTSKIGDSAKAVKTIEKNFKIIGNNSENVQRAKSWKFLKKVLAQYSILYPKTIVVDANEINEINLNFPCVIKAMNIDDGKCPPQQIFSFADLENLIFSKRVSGEILIQEFIDGISLSCSVLSNGKRAVAISVNRQLISEKFFGGCGLKYCGNIVPYDGNKELIQNIKKISEFIISDLSLIGSNGIDYVVNKDKIYFMELNPRIQDTIENVEKYSGINLVEDHIKACNGNVNVEKFKKINNNKKFYGKGIIYAEKDVKVKNFDTLNIGDVPNSECLIKKNEPICCIYEEGKSNADVFEKMKKDANRIYSNSLKFF